MKTRQRRKRIPQLVYTDNRGIGWHVSFRDRSTGLPRKHRFGKVPEERARILYHLWVSEHLKGDTPSNKPKPDLQRLQSPKQVDLVKVDDVLPGSLLHVATDLLKFDQTRTRAEEGPRTRGSIHPRVRLNRKKMLYDFLEFMNKRYGQGCLKRMMLADLTMTDVESYNQTVALAGYSHSQVSMRLQMIHALIERAGRPEFGHQLLGWNWESRDTTHGKPAKGAGLPTLAPLKKLLHTSELRERTMIWMGIGLGFGPSDLAAVRVGQIDAATYDLRRGKTGLERYGDTPPLVWDCISRYLKACPRPVSQLLFVTRTGMPVVHGRTNSIYLWWDKLRTAIGDTKHSLDGFYVLRHLGATEFGSRPSASIGEVKRWLGHSASSRVADQYMKPVSPESKAVVEWVRKSLAQSSEPSYDDVANATS